MSITPAFSDVAGHPGSGATAIGANATGTCLRSHSSWRQRNNGLVCIPAARATSEATAPGSIAAATIRSFSARGQRRRRCTDVITSTCVFVIALVLGLPLGLSRKPQARKAVFTGCVQTNRRRRKGGRQSTAKNQIGEIRPLRCSPHADSSALQHVENTRQMPGNYRDR
jgi:hypothetical protein